MARVPRVRSSRAACAREYVRSCTAPMPGAVGARFRRSAAAAAAVVW